MSEDRFFQHVRSTMTDYRPEVPEAVYSGVRKKLWWSNFTRLSATRFNIWYLSILITGTIWVWNVSTVEESASTTAESLPILVPSETIPVQIAPTSEGTTEITVVVDETNSEKNVSKKITQRVNSQPDAAVSEEETSTQRSATAESPSETSAQEIHTENVQSAEPTQQKSGSKKGLKLKSYDSTNKKD
jgi:hypothetical protein